MFAELSRIALAWDSCAGTMIHVSSSLSCGNAENVSTESPCVRGGHAALSQKRVTLYRAPAQGRKRAALAQEGARLSTDHQPAPRWARGSYCCRQR